MTKKDRIKLLTMKITRGVLWVVCLFCILMCLGEPMSRLTMVLQFTCLVVGVFLLIGLSVYELPVKIINGVKIYRKGGKEK